MKRVIAGTLLLCAGLFAQAQVTTTDKEAPKPNYRLAARFSPTNIAKWCTQLRLHHGG